MLPSKGLPPSPHPAPPTLPTNPAPNPAPQVLFTGTSGMCAHEFILDLREFKSSAGNAAACAAKVAGGPSLHLPRDLCP